MSICRFAFVLLFAAISLPGRAEIYECVDQNGNKRYTNIPAEAKGCKVLNVGPINTGPVAAPPAPKPTAKAPPGPTPPGFPRVDAQTQQSRDSQRRRILEQELGNEQRLLDQARRDLAEQEATRLGSERNYSRVLDRLEPYQRKVKLHEDNIVNLRKEIANLR
jgi:hypothetical protein